MHPRLSISGLTTALIVLLTHLQSQVWKGPWKGLPLLGRITLVRKDYPCWKGLPLLGRITLVGKDYPCWEGLPFKERIKDYPCCEGLPLLERITLVGKDYPCWNGLPLLAGKMAE